MAAAEPPILLDAAMFTGNVIINGGTFNQHNTARKETGEVLVLVSSRFNPELLYKSKKHDTLRERANLLSIDVAKSQISDLIACQVVDPDAHDDPITNQLESVRRLQYRSKQLEYAQTLSLSLSEELERCGALLAGIILPSLYPVDVYQIISIIIYQMARKIPSFSRHVEDVLKSDPLVFEYTAELQVEKLIVGPLIEAAKEVPSDRRRPAPIVVVTGSYAQLAEGSPCAQVFNTISAISKQRGLEAPFSLILISVTAGRLAPLAPILARAKAVSGNQILAIITLSFTYASVDPNAIAMLAHNDTFLAQY